MANIFKKILSRLNPLSQKNAYRLIDLSHYLNAPILTALAWRKLIREMDEVSQNRNSRKRILVLSKSAGIDDVRESLQGSPINAKVDILSRSVIKRSAKRYLKNRVTDISYISNNAELEKDKLRYRNHLKKTLQYFAKYYGCDVIIQFSYTYYAERELAAACSEVGIRFLTAHKECLNSEPMKAHKIDRVKEGLGNYEGYKISVYNDSQKEVITSSGFADEWRVDVVGCPRVNASHRKRSVIPDDDKTTTILYYLINEEAGLPSYIENGKTRRGIKINGTVATWKPMVEQVDKTLIQFARDHSNVRIILKTKTGFTKAQLKNFNLNSMPGNIEIVKEGTGHDLLDDAHIVVGFNSTAVLEAVAAGRKTIVPLFENLLNPKVVPYAIDMEQGVLLAKNKKAFKAFLEESVADPKIAGVLKPGQKNLLDKLLGNGDGSADERFKSFVENALHPESPEQS